MQASAPHPGHSLPQGVGAGSGMADLPGFLALGEAPGGPEGVRSSFFLCLCLSPGVTSVLC